MNEVWQWMSRAVSNQNCNKFTEEGNSG